MRTAPSGMRPTLARLANGDAGRLLDSLVRARMEPAFQKDFSRVRVHDDGDAAEAARALHARAFTVGEHIIFGPGEHRPARVNASLLVHEMSHVAQQSSAAGRTIPDAVGLLDAAEDAQAERDVARLSARALDGVSAAGAPAVSAPAIQRQRIGTAVTHPRGSRSAFRRITATFDGREFVVHGDGTEIQRAPAQSGRPLLVRAADAAACGGATSEPYLNNPRCVRTSDNGPIGEGPWSADFHRFLRESRGSPRRRSRSCERPMLGEDVSLRATRRTRASIRAGDEA